VLRSEVGKNRDDCLSPGHVGTLHAAEHIARASTARAAQENVRARWQCSDVLSASPQPGPLADSRIVMSNLQSLRHLIDETDALHDLMRDARTECGLTQGQLADRLGVRQGDVSRWESGAVRPTHERLRALVAALESARG